MTNETLVMTPRETEDQSRVCITPQKQEINVTMQRARERGYQHFDQSSSTADIASPGYKTYVNHNCEAAYYANGGKHWYQVGYILRAEVLPIVIDKASNIYYLGLISF
jgi:hypothetical protein